MSHHHSARWASGAETQPAPNVPTQFEELVYALGLEKRPDLWPHDQKIVRFVRSNRKIRYDCAFDAAKDWRLECKTAVTGRKNGPKRTPGPNSKLPSS